MYYEKLNSDELQEIKSICDTWLFSNNIKNKNTNLLYEYCKGIDFNPVIKAFTSRLQTINWKFSKSEEVSGSICFFGGVVTSLLNYGYIKEIEGLFTFAVCYMLIDHFLDNTENTDIEKDECIRDIYNFVVLGEKNNNKLVLAVGDRYLDLIKRVPESREYFIKLFQSEIRGVTIQRSSIFERDVYLKIAEEKGGLTSLCIASILGLEMDNDNNYNLGLLIQMTDDSLDIQDDIALGIYTLARYDIDHGNLDRYIYENIVKINNLSPVYNLFKIILLSGMILGVHDNPNSITDSLKDIIKEYDVYEGTSKDELIQWFYGKLSDYINLDVE